MHLDKTWRCQTGALCYVRCPGCPGPKEEQGLARIYSELAKRQEPLGADFEKVWNENLETLYEN